MRDEYYFEDGKIKNKYTDREYTMEEICFRLSVLEREAYRTARDIERCIELKAVNRHLRMENRFLTIKLQQLACRGMLDISEIEKEISALCLNPDEVSEYIHKFEKENFELKKKLKEQGNYIGDFL
ncbi:hypothetical protein [uncultured Methanobrevibacter sp.]|uniref:hypothetical protein n=1 Tax=uncultured Methanobrevibacter sp. TaxID=253161 RepID=UPI0025DDE3E4|nr:hypothetical protein [uncultured Methanobrevibacter sp.]